MSGRNNAQCCWQQVRGFAFIPVQESNDSARQMSTKKGRPSAEESKFRLEDTTTGLRSYYKIHGHYNVPAGSHFVQFGGREAFDLGKQLAVYRRTSPESTQRQGETFVFCLQVVCVVKQQHWIDFRCMHTVTCN